MPRLESIWVAREICRGASEAVRSLRLPGWKGVCFWGTHVQAGFIHSRRRIAYVDVEELCTVTTTQRTPCTESRNETDIQPFSEAGKSLA